MQVQAYVRIERFMLAKPTAASPANYKKDAGKAQNYRVKLIKSYLIKCVQCLTINLSVDGYEIMSRQTEGSAILGRIKSYGTVYQFIKHPPHKFHNKSQHLHSDKSRQQKISIGEIKNLHWMIKGKQNVVRKEILHQGPSKTLLSRQEIPIKVQGKEEFISEVSCNWDEKIKEQIISTTYA